MPVAWELFNNNLSWMGWNLFLAFIPLALSLVLFTPQTPLSNSISINKNWRNPIWGLGTLVFILFLPNAAYIFTDIIHLFSNIREPEISRKGLFLLILPQYICFLVVGFECYVLALLRLSNYLQARNAIARVTWFELGINLICAVGVYLGRFNRLNSWNIVTKPITLVRTVTDNLDDRHFLIFTLIFFGTITILYYLFKQLSLVFIGNRRF
jgi:uncharacterized membrane protein